MHQEDEGFGAPDAVLIEQLAATGYAGATWARVSDVFARYALVRLEAWYYTGHIFEECSKRNYGLRRGGYRLTAKEVESLCGDTVVAGLNSFRRKQLAGGGWRSDGGASLTTWIMYSCIQAFPNEWRRCCKKIDEDRDRSVATSYLADIESPDGVEGPLTSPSAEDSALRGLCNEDWSTFKSTTPLRTQRIAVLSAQGYSHQEIAEILDEGLTARAVEGLLHRLRKQHSEKDEA